MRFVIVILAIGITKFVVKIQVGRILRVVQSLEISRTSGDIGWIRRGRNQIGACKM